jgi:ABC-type antimicrobial peptide transport system permease subunit
VIGLVARQGARIVGAGLVLGLAGAAALGRTVGSMIEAVGAYDALTWSVVPLVLGAAGFLACWLPARRATSIDPVVALREDAEG